MVAIVRYPPVRANAAPPPLFPNLAAAPPCSNVAFMGHKYPSTAIDNWSAAHKLRRHFEERTEARKAAGKPTF